MTGVSRKYEKVTDTKLNRTCSRGIGRWPSWTVVPAGSASSGRREVPIRVLEGFRSGPKWRARGMIASAHAMFGPGASVAV